MYIALDRPLAYPLNVDGPCAWGLGDMQSAEQSVSLGTAAAGTAASVLALPAVGLISAAAVPFIGPAIAAVSLVVMELVKNSGCGQTCIETSEWANQAASALGQNIAAYFDQPAPRSASSQALALQNFDSVWARLSQMCSDPSTGNAGKRCISDRQAGSCKWTQPAAAVPPWGTPAAGACWNWFNGYRDPIANDPDVVADSALSSVTDTAVAAASGALSAAGVSSSYAAPLLLAAVVALGLWAVL